MPSVPPAPTADDPARPLPGVRDASRLAALAATGLMDSDAEASFDRFTSLATQAFGFPVALVSLVDGERQFFKSAVGLPEPWASRRETPLSHSFCQHVVSTGAPLVVPDASKHPLLRHNLAVRDLGVAAYAGMPLTTSDGHTLGAFCVVSGEPHAWTNEELATLRQLAAAVMTEVELRRAVRRLTDEAEAARRTKEALRASEERYRTLVSHLPNTSVILFDHDLRCMIADGEELLNLLGVPATELRGNILTDYAVPEHLELVRRTYRNTLEGFEATLELKRNGRYLEIHTRPIRDDDGTITAGMVMVYDITMVKEAEVALRAQTAAMKLIEDVATAANEARTTSEAFRRVLERVGAHMGWPVGHAFLRDGDDLVPSDIWYLADAEAAQPFVEETRATRFTRGVALGRVLDTGRAMWIDDIANNTAYVRHASASKVGLSTGLAFPVLVGDEVAAVLEFVHPGDGEPDAALVALMTNIGMQLGRVVERERYHLELRTLSLRDELTGLLNRRGFMDLGHARHRLAASSGRSFTLIFADLNGMKPINDQLGHEAGDRALRDTGDLLRSVFRGGDLVARLGGDEFVVLTEDAHAARLEQRIRDAMGAFNASGARPYRLSVSLGTATFDPTAPRSLETLLADADGGMYAQKRARRENNLRSMVPTTFGRVG